MKGDEDAPALPRDCTGVQNLLPPTRGAAPLGGDSRAETLLAGTRVASSSSAEAQEALGEQRRIRPFCPFTLLISRGDVQE